MVSGLPLITDCRIPFFRVQYKPCGPMTAGLTGNAHAPLTHIFQSIDGDPMSAADGDEMQQREQFKPRCCNATDRRYPDLPPRPESLFGWRQALI